MKIDGQHQTHSKGTWCSRSAVTLFLWTSLWLFKCNILWRSRTISSLMWHSSNISFRKITKMYLNRMTCVTSVQVELCFYFLCVWSQLLPAPAHIFPALFMPGETFFPPAIHVILNLKQSVAGTFPPLICHLQVKLAATWNAALYIRYRICCRISRTCPKLVEFVQYLEKISI